MKSKYVHVKYLIIKLCNIIIHYIYYVALKPVTSPECYCCNVSFGVIFIPEGSQGVTNSMSKQDNTQGLIQAN